MTPKLDSFSEERAALAALRDRVGIERDWSRLEEIYDFTEAHWWEYVKKLQNRSIRYVAIGEAPPWVNMGHPQYVLDPNSRGTPYIHALRSAFQCPKDYSVAEALDYLAANDFLWLDSIPFALKYRSTDRKLSAYQALVRLTVQNYLVRKVDTANLKFALNAKITFVLRLNAEAIFKNIRRLLLGGHEFVLSEKLIAANGAGYPDGVRMRGIYDLEA
jgi:hypothetical protein